jgi:eukaryotic-like serine/threonine-protein kinase
MEKGSEPFPFSANGAATETSAQFSPDGRYVAYVSEETGRVEVYVRPFSPSPGPQPAGKWMVSAQGGRIPEWSPDGTKLLWVSRAPFTVMSAAVDTSPGFHAGAPALLYPVEDIVARFGQSTASGAGRLLTRRGQGLILTPAGQQADEPISLLMNWASMSPRN